MGRPRRIRPRFCEQCDEVFLLTHNSPRQRFCSFAEARRTAVETRFWAKVDRRGDDECWVWQGARTDARKAFENRDAASKGRWSK